MKKSCIFFVSAMLFISHVYGQIEISISENTYENEVEIALDVDVTSLNLNQTGEQNWVFNHAIESIGAYNKRIAVDASPYGEYFPDADWCVQALQYIPEMNYELIPGTEINIADTLLDTYFYQVSGESFIQETGMGFAHPFVLDTLKAYLYPEPALTYPLPLTKEAEPWVEYRQVMIQQFILWSATITDSSVVEVDAWGDLTVESGTYPCLRLKRTEKRNVFVEDLVDEDIYTYTYLWLTYDFQPVLSVTGMDTAVFDKALYMVRTSSPVSTPVICDPDCGPVAAASRDFILSQNFPNPFNPSTTIGYTLPGNADIKLTVYSLLGQEVITLYEGFQQQGSHSIVWNGLNAEGQKMPSGIYIYQLRSNNLNQAENLVLTSKMILTQ